MEAGFVEVSVQDRTDQFVQILKDELIKFRAIKEEFVKVRTWDNQSPVYLSKWPDSYLIVFQGRHEWVGLCQIHMMPFHALHQFYFVYKGFERGYIHILGFQ